MPIAALLIEKLLYASHMPSYKCSQLITNTLCDCLPIKAATFYSYFEQTKLLTLRAQTGFDYSLYKSFELPLSSLAGRAVTRGLVIQKNNLILDEGFRDKILVTKYSLDSFIAFPLVAGSCIESFNNKICQTFSGVICIYPKENATISQEIINKLSLLIGEVYDYAVETDRMLMRTDIVNTSIATSKDLNSFLNKVLTLLSEKWRLEASSVFIFDERNETLYMRATTGVDSLLPMVGRAYSKEEQDRNTVKCFLQENPITLVEPDIINPAGKYPEIVAKDKKSQIYIPIFEPTYTEKNKEIIGVFRTINRIVVRKNITETCCHGWEDASILLFVAEIIGIIRHLFRRSDEISLNFERAMHGINKPIKAAKTRLNSVYRYDVEKQRLDPPFAYYLKNSISYIDALEWQIEKHTSRDRFKKISINKTRLYGPVLSKIVAFITALYQTYNVQKIYVSRLTDYNFNKVPYLEANEKALQTVFRNLAENAMKYHKKGRTCEIKFSWMQDNKFVYVSLLDNGIGIAEKDVQKIFNEGYRSLDAMRREPTGTGIGLPDSRNIMKEMEGDLFLKNRKNPTEFVVKIKKWEN